MSLPRNQQEELFSADKELPDFLPAENLMMVFSREIYLAFKDEEYAQCYSTSASGSYTRTTAPISPCRSPGPARRRGLGAG
jgi:hypothetical protein